jgi:hypothetical protein
VKSLHLSEEPWELGRNFQRVKQLVHKILPRLRNAAKSPSRKPAVQIGDSQQSQVMGAIIQARLCEERQTYAQICLSNT